MEAEFLMVFLYQIKYFYITSCYVNNTYFLLKPETEVGIALPFFFGCCYLLVVGVIRAGIDIMLRGHSGSVLLRQCIVKAQARVMNSLEIQRPSPLNCYMQVCEMLRFWR